MTDSTESTTASVTTETSHPKISPTSKSTTPDDLLEMYENEPTERANEINKIVDQKNAVEKRTEEKKLAKDLANKVEAKGGVNKKEDSIDEATKKASKDVELPKLFKAKHGDKELDIPEEAEVILQIDGKEVPVKFTDMKKGFADLETRTRDVHRKLNWVDSREKSLQKEYSSINDKFKTISELAAQGDHMLAVRTLAEMAGKDPVEYERQIMDTLNKYVEVYHKMTPEQREAHFLKRKNDHLTKQLERKNGESNFERSKTDLQTKIQTLQKQHGIPEDMFFQHYNALVNSKVFSKEEEIQPEHVVEYHQHLAHVGKVFEGIQAVDAGLLNDEDFIDEVINLTKSKSKDLSAQDIAVIVKDAFSKDPSVESLNKKVQSSGTKSGHASSKKESNDTIDDELYEDFFGKRTVVAR